jgi:hypothetical protein
MERVSGCLKLGESRNRDGGRKARCEAVNCQKHKHKVAWYRCYSCKGVVGGWVAVCSLG